MCSLVELQAVLSSKKASVGAIASPLLEFGVSQRRLHARIRSDTYPELSNLRGALRFQTGTVPASSSGEAKGSRAKQNSANGHIREDKQARWIWAKA